MEQILKLTCPLPPSVNHYMAYRVSGGRGKKFVQAYKTQDSIRFEKEFNRILEKEIQKQKWIIVEEGYVIVEVEWFFESNRRDSNNYHKLILDCMNQKVFKDDKQAMERTMNITIDPKNPRAEIKIYKSNKQGLFTNEEDKKIFYQNNCCRCSKKKNNCSVYKKILSNKIGEEFDLKQNICFKIKNKKVKEEVLNI